MIHLANSLLVWADGPAARALHAALADASHEGPLVHTGAEALAAARSRRPDVIILGEHPADMPALEVARALAADPATTDIPVFLLAQEWHESRLPELLPAGVDDAMPWPADPRVLAARLRPLVRLSTMRAELALRAGSADRLGIAVAAHVDAPDDRPAVLVAGDATDIRRVREAVGDIMEVVEAEGLFAAESVLSRRIFDGFVIGTGAGSPESALETCEGLRRNPRLFTLPVVLLMDPGRLGDPARPYLLGASQVAPPDAGRESLRWALSAPVRTQQARWAIRRAIDRTKVPALASGDLPDLYGPRFLSAYLENRAAAARAQGKHLSVIHFAFGGVARIAEEFGAAAAAHLCQQLGRWVLSLTRAEDLVCALTASRIAVVLPDTPLDEAEVVMHRIAGVIGHTDFAVQDVYEVVQVWPRCAAAALEGEETADTLLARVEDAAAATAIA